MHYDFSQDELSQMAELLGITSSELSERVDFDDDVVIFAIFEDRIKIRTGKNQHIVLSLKELPGH